MTAPVVVEDHRQVVLMDGFKLEPGDKMLLLAPADTFTIASEVDDIRTYLLEAFPGVEFVIIAGFAGAQMQKRD